MRELRAITDALRAVFERRGFGEVSTPAIEYESVLRAADDDLRPAYRVFDDHGEVLALRTDMTVPIARLAATRYPTADPPLRFWYLGARLPRGAPAPRPDARVPAGRHRAARRAGAGRHRRGARRPVRGAGRRRAAGLPDRAGRRGAVPGAAARLRRARGGPRADPARAGHPRLRRASSARRAGSTSRRRRPTVLVRVPQLRGGPERPGRPPGPGGRRRWPACARPSPGSRRPSPSGSSSTSAWCAGMGYYTGAVFDVYDPALGSPIGGRRALRRPGRALRALAARRRLRPGDRPPAPRAGRGGAAAP